MATTGAPHSGAPTSLLGLLARIVGLAIVDAIAIAFCYSFYTGGLLIGAVALGLITAAINVVFLVERLYPLRWISPGVFLLVLVVVYPLVYTVYVAFTNYGGSHILTKQQVIDRYEQQFFTPEGAASLSWRAFRSPDGKYLIWLDDKAGNIVIAEEDAGISPVDSYSAQFGPLDPEDGLPTTIGNYSKLSRQGSVRFLDDLAALAISDKQSQLHIVSLDRAELGQQLWRFDPAQNALLNQKTGAVYGAQEGFFIGPDGDQLTPGFSDFIGPRNFIRALTDPLITAPFFGVFVWTVAFAGLTVVICFSLGLALALVLNDDRLPLKGLYRTLIIIPYTVPAFISALVWQGLLNPSFGPINSFLRDTFGLNPQWFSDGTLAKTAVLLVNLWLGYPYMMIVALGALQSISTDMYEAAEIDGASPFQRFRSITFPLLMVAIAPLLIGSFAFNFNNFTLIDLVTEGGPGNPGSITPAGQTDILISYSYRVAFAAGQGSDYGFASAIGIFIFLIVAGITIFNFRLSRRLENLV